MKTLKEYMGMAGVGTPFDSLQPMASMGDHPPKTAQRKRGAIVASTNVPGPAGGSTGAPISSTKNTPLHKHMGKSGYLKK